eukprot:CAMPEP_0194216766 /NCGR_PEP_ID=MMETSP0156-20130528/19625_1 /TAXON_ID=33649 /ORGANISM="Thalassionema nitzschioides, Strain L26-B" /LENGTH=863 /DNA_ID=CAMNT_0038945603 /DNA_START=86 /DNA_END=2677 /DNA_ORIENTATION=+
MSPLEIEDEQLSLVEETSDRAPNLRKRNNVAFSHTQQGEVSGNVTGFRGLLRSKTAYVVRNITLLGILAWMAYIMMTSMENVIDELDMDDRFSPPHQSSFVHGINPGSLNFKLPDWKTLEDNVGQEVISVSKVNTLNFAGRYWHDPYTSMYASDIYEEPILEAQAEFETRFNDTLEQYGGWNFIDSVDNRPVIDFSRCGGGDLYDCPSEKFPDNTWQMDEQYVGDFISQSKQLISRVKEGIYEEYGHSSFNDDGVTRKSEKELEERSTLFQVLIVPDGTTKASSTGVAILSEVAWNGLIRKLLHSIITGDYFFVTVIGDDIAAGHGNNFVQSAIMQFQFLMEPVFDLLGVHLLSRNMASSDPSSRLLGALAGGDLYGEMDILWYDVEDEVESQGVKDLLFKQSILSGDRVPLILAEDPVEILRDSNETAWMGSLNTDEQLICGKNNKLQVCKFHDYNTVCWIPRNDGISPGVDQDDHIKNPGGKYPGRYVHQLKARKLSMLLLHALDAALDVWVDGIQENGFPLQDNYWHVGDVYTNIRESVRQNPHSSACGTLMGPDFEALCHVELHGRTEWTPRITPSLTGLHNILSEPLPSAKEQENNIYDMIDLWPSQWKIPEGQADPHLMAIASYIPKPTLEDYYDMWEFDDDEYDWGITDDDAVLEMINSDSSQNVINTTMDNTTDGFLRKRTLINDTAGAFDSDENDIGDFNSNHWSLYNIVGGFCDGSSQSTCHRSPDNTCLMAGHVDFPRGGIISNSSDSGWLKFLLGKMSEKIVLLRLEWDNDLRRTLKQEAMPEGFWFEYFINNNEENIITLDHHQFVSHSIKVDQVTLLPILLLSSEVENEVTLSLRVRGGSAALTHLYFA